MIPDFHNILSWSRKNSLVWGEKMLQFFGFVTRWESIGVEVVKIISNVI